MQVFLRTLTLAALVAALVTAVPSATAHGGCYHSEPGGCGDCNDGQEHHHYGPESCHACPFIASVDCIAESLVGSLAWLLDAGMTAKAALTAN